MKLSLAIASFVAALPAPLALSLALGAAGALAGCGSLDAETQGVEYPQTPIGYDPPPPPQGVASSGVQPVGPEAQPSGQPSYAAPSANDVEVGASADTYVDTDPSALTDFKPALDPYGDWVEDTSYGTVWVPSTTVVGADFAPYVTAGHWSYADTSADWVWVSDYDWGWAPFHYGRWVYIAGRGWAWIPGRTYAGAWVSWRYGIDDYGYIGWAPLPPTWYWYGGYAVGIGYVPPAPYVFCGVHDVFAPVVAQHIVHGADVPVVAGRTRPYVPATPVVAGGATHAVARAAVAGPPPSMLRIAPSSVVAAPATNRGLARATEFARPQTAVALGARPPMTVARNATMVGAMASPRPVAPGVPRAYGTASSPVATRLAPTATAPQYRGIAPTPYRAPYASPSVTAAPYAPRMASPAYPSSPSFSTPRMPAYPSSPSFSTPRMATPSAPAFSAPRMSAPAMSAPHMSAPAMSAPHMSAPSHSAPSVRVAAPHGHR